MYAIFAKIRLGCLHDVQRYYTTNKVHGNGNKQKKTPKFGVKFCGHILFKIY